MLSTGIACENFAHKIYVDADIASLNYFYRGSTLGVCLGQLRPSFCLFVYFSSLVYRQTG